MDHAVLLKDELACPVCLTLPSKGSLLQCRQGHLVCESCYRRLEDASPDPTCPQCRGGFLIMEDTKMPQRNLVATRLLDSLPFSCECGIHGMSRRESAHHESLCPRIKRLRAAFSTIIAEREEVRAYYAHRDKNNVGLERATRRSDADNDDCGAGTGRPTVGLEKKLTFFLNAVELFLEDELLFVRATTGAEADKIRWQADGLLRGLNGIMFAYRRSKRHAHEKRK